MSSSDRPGLIRYLVDGIGAKFIGAPASHVNFGLHIDVVPANPVNNSAKESLALCSAELELWQSSILPALLHTGIFLRFFVLIILIARVNRASSSPGYVTARKHGSLLAIGTSHSYSHEPKPLDCAVCSVPHIHISDC